ncbi:sugar O-acetyltransferase [Arthrobacter sp. AK01]|uniref:sugar O-acetyltransferase n=1 Tax=Micrococcaceae TaxID=1268 RepID=UPI001E3E84FB|nr:MULTISPECIES: sugar O-acetyltransferase [Micrococcaceae]MCD4853325.1 sugar O-acetyltransferase [Arthrobacter sp. AK01]MCP1412380.1 maltose O-acetyltransferase [Paenarthrobacter sp. A20]
MASDYFLGDPRTNYERMISGDFYISDDQDITAKQQRAIRLAGEFHAAFLDDVEAAQAVARELLGAMGADSHIRAPIYVDYGFNVTVGSGTFINYNLTALDVAPIRIGSDCQIGPNVQLLTPTHPLEAKPRRDKLEAAKPIVIGDNVWLGGGVIVLAGVTIGENSVVGAGSVVTKDLPADVLAVGSPAKVIKSIG